MTITVSEWKRLSPLLDAALDLAPGERAGWLASLPPEHADLRERLRELLAGRRAIETGDFMNRLPEFSAPPELHPLRPDSLVGPYRLLRELGAGGTSTVWLAERADGSIQRKVALKLPHAGLVDRDIAQRLAREREILASLEHPNIARLYDAGVDEHDRPYLALEYVKGIPPDEYCRARQLNLRQKLGLFLQILRAVAFAHARLVVHRDLKPNNILIDDDGGVRLLDFGIARLLQPEPGSGPMFTIAGATALTPAYAAPEQFNGRTVTVATDVYSLGVILYEMLAGKSPYLPKGNSLGAYELEVLNAEPRLMSRNSANADAAALRGDLDTIVAKALEKAPVDRYASAEAFAADLERYLAAQPIAARPRSFGYVARKFLRRNAWPVAIAASVMVLLTAALGVAAWQWRDAERQRRVAIERLANSQAASEFTSTVLIEGIQPGEALTFEQLIALSEQIARQAGDADLRTRVFATGFLADWYAANGLYARAESILARTIESLPADSPMLGAELRCARADLWGQLGRAKEAIATLTREIAANDADDSIASACLLARAHIAANSGDAASALDFGNEALRRYERAGVNSVYTRTQITRIIAAAHGLGGNFEGAHAGYRESLRLFEAAGRARSRAAASVHDDWSTSWLNSGHPRRALEELDLARQITGEFAPNSQIPDSQILRRARILTQLARYEEATREFALAHELAAGRGNVVSIAGALIGEADLAIARGDLPGAARLLESAATGVRNANLPENHLISTRLLTTQAALFAARGDDAQARALSTRAIEAYRAQGCCHGTIALLFANRAELALRDGLVEAAAMDAAQALELAPDGAGSFSRFTGQAWYASGLVHERAGRAREARSAFANSAAQFAGAVGESHPDTARARTALARLGD